MATLARTEVLEQKLAKHMREHADTMKNLRSELQLLKTKPKAATARDQRPLNDNVLKKVGPSDNSRKFPAKSLKASNVPAVAVGKCTSSNNHSTAGDKMTNKMNVQTHPHAEDEHVTLYGTSSLRTASTVSSRDTCVSVPASVMTRINYSGSIMSSPLSPIKLLEFLISELKTKLKDYVAEDDYEIAKAFNEINQTVRKAKLERRLNQESLHQLLECRPLLSAATQTAVNGSEIEELVNFQAKHSSTQMELDVNLRRMEEVFTLELKKSDDKITKLSEDINSLQQKLRSGIDDKSTTMSHHIDLKTEEIKGEMKFLLRMIEERKSHNLIDNFNQKLAQTQQRVDEVQRKCTETAKHCLQMHGNHLVRSHALKTRQMESELGHIRALMARDVDELRDVLTLTRPSQVAHSKSASSLCSQDLSPSSSSSLLLSSSSQSEELSSESIISSARMERDFHREMGIGCADKSNGTADEKDNDLMCEG